MELLYPIFCCRYPPLGNIVRNVNSYVTIETVKQSVWAHACGVITTVVVRKLCQREEFGPGCLIVRSVSSKVILDDSVESFTLSIRLRVIRCRQSTFHDLHFTHLTPEIRSNSGVTVTDNTPWCTK